MLQAIKEHVVIQAGGRIEIDHTELPPGALAEVIVVVEGVAPEPPPLTSFMGKGKGCFADAAEIDAFIRSERDSWE